MKIVIPGGTGQIGTLLARTLAAQGHEVAALSRARASMPRSMPRSMPWRTVCWDGATIGAWVAEIDGADVVINLAGHNVNCRIMANRR